MFLLVRVTLVALMLSKVCESTSLGAVVNTMPLGNKDDTKVMALYSILAPLPCPSLLQMANTGPGYVPPLQGQFPAPGWCLSQWQNVTPNVYTSTVNVENVNETLQIWSGPSVHPGTHAVNQAPTVALPPPIRVSTGCARHVALSVKDADGDQICCRFAETSPTFLQLSQDCLLSYTGGGDPGQYEVKITVEDFPKTGLVGIYDNTTALSATPLHLSITVTSGLGPCTAVPVFTQHTPPDGFQFTVLPFEEINITVTAQLETDVVSEIAVVGPPGLWVSPLESDKNVNAEASINIIWVRASNQLPQLLPICFTANTESSQSDIRCVWIDQKPMDILPNGTVLLCLKKEMHLILPVTSLPHLSFTDLQLNHPSCPIYYNDTHVTAVVSLTGCGTKVVHSGSDLIYTNTLRTVNHLSTISRHPSLVLLLACRFSESLVRDNPQLVNLPTEKETFGIPHFSVEFYRPGEGPRSMGTNMNTRQRRARASVQRAGRVDVLDMYVYSNCSVGRAELIVQTCVMSSTPTFEVTQPIIEDGCMNTSGIMEMVSNDPKLNIYEMNLASFNIEGTVMYVRCVVHLCISILASQTCPSLCHQAKQDVLLDTLVTRDYTIYSAPISLVSSPSIQSPVITPVNAVPVTQAITSTKTTTLSHAPAGNPVSVTIIALATFCMLLTQ
ncbi:uncharacterized protein LOC125706400 isoform X2 [Brienomyrus brachyistius]|uniref:uncharacterized protein LOC125706400 isoform X2 n=1 Tax=Brienomyrus brachyistius TaxID=42636 RepID=UPI0020B1D101|nr:uncharacterized protein LOC125706400 isoform X2 [Brienomyrus brachyistius]XP_048829045.1 uncharacterized protein LOC125706400 isoform X2 [Brienomyrus brachyistius]